MECSILLMGNTVKWKGGDIYTWARTKQLKKNILLVELQGYWDILDIVLF